MASLLYTIMSYPSLLPGSDPKRNHVTFSVPNHKVIRKIMKNLEDDENLRVKVSGKAIEKRLDEIVSLFERYEIESSPIEGHQELRVRLFGPRSPKTQSTLFAEGNNGATYEARESSVHEMMPKYVIHEPSRTQLEQRKKIFGEVARKHRPRKYSISHGLDEPRYRQQQPRCSLYTIEESIMEV